MIPSLVVDTDVLSFIFKHDTRAVSYIPHLADKVVIICFMTLAELRQWALVRNWGTVNKQRLENFLQSYIIFHSDDRLCAEWSEVTYMAIRNGRPIDSADAWIAATAMLHNVPLVTHNKKHYAGVDGLTIISESHS
jgi:predicted nucleic acid-binding protein